MSYGECNPAKDLEWSGHIDYIVKKFRLKLISFLESSNDLSSLIKGKYCELCFLDLPFLWNSECGCSWAADHIIISHEALIYLNNCNILCSSHYRHVRASNCQM